MQQPDPQPVYRYTGNHGDQSSFGYTLQQLTLQPQRAQRISAQPILARISVYKKRHRLSCRTDQLTGSNSPGPESAASRGLFDVHAAAIAQRTRLMNLSYSVSLLATAACTPR